MKTILFPYKARGQHHIIIDINQIINIIIILDLCFPRQLVQPGPRLMSCSPRPKNRTIPLENQTVEKHNKMKFVGATRPLILRNFLAIGSPPPPTPTPPISQLCAPAVPQQCPRAPQSPIQSNLNWPGPF